MDPVLTAKSTYKSWAKASTYARVIANTSIWEWSIVGQVVNETEMIEKPRKTILNYARFS